MFPAVQFWPTSSALKKTGTAYDKRIQNSWTFPLWSFSAGWNTMEIPNTWCVVCWWLGEVSCGQVFYLLLRLLSALVTLVRERGGGGGGEGYRRAELHGAYLNLDHTRVCVCVMYIRPSISSRTRTGILLFYHWDLASWGTGFCAPCVIVILCINIIYIDMIYTYIYLYMNILHRSELLVFSFISSDSTPRSLSVVCVREQVSIVIVSTHVHVIPRFWNVGFQKVGEEDLTHTSVFDARCEYRSSMWFPDVISKVLGSSVSIRIKILQSLEWIINDCDVSDNTGAVLWILLFSVEDKLSNSGCVGGQVTCFRTVSFCCVTLLCARLCTDLGVSPHCMSIQFI